METDNTGAVSADGVEESCQSAPKTEVDGPASDHMDDAPLTLSQLSPPKPNPRELEEDNENDAPSVEEAPAEPLPLSSKRSAPVDYSSHDDDVHAPPRKKAKADPAQGVINGKSSAPTTKPPAPRKPIKRLSSSGTRSKPRVPAVTKKSKEGAPGKPPVSRGGRSGTSKPDRSGQVDVQDIEMKDKENEGEDVVASDHLGNVESTDLQSQSEGGKIKSTDGSTTANSRPAPSDRANGLSGTGKGPQTGSRRLKVSVSAYPTFSRANADT